MKAQKWYQYKRYWIPSSLLLLLFFIGKMEVFEMRYQETDFAKKIVAAGQISPIFKQKKVAGTTMQYVQVGNDENLPNIIFVHGSPGALSAYETYLQDTFLVKSANLLAVDRLGFGYSDFGKTVHSLSIQANLIAAILKDLPSKRNILVGHSMGGPVISKLAMNFPDLVNGLVLVAPAISPELEPSNRWRKILDLGLFRCLTPAALRVCNQEIIPLKEELLKMMRHWNKITCPVTVIQGTIDNLVPVGNAYFAKKMLINSPAVELKLIEEGNHFILWSETSLITQAILDKL